MKAVEITWAIGLKIVEKLGGFHSLMSFERNLGMVMEGSGLDKLLETIYAPNSFLHILPDKAIGKAIRGYFLADTTLKIKMFFPVFSSYENFKERTEDEIENEVTLEKTGSSSAGFKKIL